MGNRLDAAAGGAGCRGAEVTLSAVPPSETSGFSGEKSASLTKLTGESDAPQKSGISSMLLGTAVHHRLPGSIAGSIGGESDRAPRRAMHVVKRQFFSTPNVSTEKLNSIARFKRAFLGYHLADRAPRLGCRTQTGIGIAALCRIDAVVSGASSTRDQHPAKDCRSEKPQNSAVVRKSSAAVLQASDHGRCPHAGRHKIERRGSPNAYPIGAWIMDDQKAVVPTGAEICVEPLIVATRPPRRRSQIFSLLKRRDECERPRSVRALLRPNRRPGRALRARRSARQDHC